MYVPTCRLTVLYIYILAFCVLIFRMKKITLLLTLFTTYMLITTLYAGQKNIPQFITN